MRSSRFTWNVLTTAVWLVIGAGMCPTARAEVRLPNVFGSHMVLQQDKPLIIWGWAQANETVTVQMAGASQTAQAHERGEWKAELPAMKAGGPYTLTVSGSSTVRPPGPLCGTKPARSLGRRQDLAGTRAPTDQASLRAEIRRAG